jgi:hypothetical protein
MNTTTIHPEFASVSAFVEYLLDDERDEFTLREATEVALATGQRPLSVVRELEGWGLTFVPPAAPKVVRGYRSNNHNRWEGNPGAGGSGWEVISGFAGQTG